MNARPDFSRGQMSTHFLTGALGLQLRNYDARKGQEKGKVCFRAFKPEIPRSQIDDFKEEFGRGEWIRTTDLWSRTRTSLSSEDPNRRKNIFRDFLPLEVT